MSKGNPNDATRKLNFIPKVWDAKADDGAGAYRPIYIAPEATDKVLGDVYLSDSVSSTDSAATGVTAATPKAVKTVNDNANNKLDKTTSSAQTVKSAVTFSGAVTGSAGMTVPDGQYFTGNLRGNADTASQLSPGRNITVKGTGTGAETVKFTGASDITLTLGEIAASKITGVLDISNIPQGALERVVNYASISAAVSAWTSAAEGSKPFDIGDTVRVTGVTPNVMYAVVADPSKTASYVEYAAGTASEALHADNADEAAHAVNADVATKLGNATVGGNAKPIYLNAGTATASTATVGSGVKPVYMNAGTITQSSSTAGATNRPVYMNAGAITQIDYTIEKSVPADAKFTDTTYSVMKAATASAAGASGLVPAPPAGANVKFLRGDGTWQVAGEVTGVKGNAESAYRTGNVNLTPANIGAAASNHNHDTVYLKLAGGTLTGTVNARDILPVADSAYDLGASANRFANIYADTFTGNLSGNVTGSLSGNATTATTASRLNNTVTITGDITSSAISFNTTSAITINTSLGEGVVESVNLMDKAVTNGKLADDVGTVYVGDTEPTEAHIKLWVKI